jgi:hypothetical protein
MRDGTGCEAKARGRYFQKLTSYPSWSGALPDPQLLLEMGKFNERLMKAGVLPSIPAPKAHASNSPASLVPSSTAPSPRPRSSSPASGSGRRSPSKRLEWVRRCPNPHASDSEIKIRQVFEMEDFAPVLSEEQIEHKVAKRAEQPNQTANK